jgi:hypothetical protein
MIPAIAITSRSVLLSGMSDSGLGYPALREVCAGDRARSTPDPARVEESVEIDLPGSVDDEGTLPTGSPTIGL